MKKFLAIFSVSALMIGMASCGGSKTDSNSDPLTGYFDSIDRADSLREWGPPKAITFANAKDTGDADGMRVTIEGYIAVGSTIYESGSSTSLQLWERKGQHDGDYISVGVNIGSGNNEMQSLPDDYKKTDLALKDDKGNEVHYGDRVKITGIYDAPYSDGYGSIDIQSFEKVEDIAFDYAGLGATKIEQEAEENKHEDLNGHIVYAEGYLEIPSFVYVTETCYFDLVKKAGADDYVTVDIVIGTGPNMVEEFPDDYGPDDIKIHDDKDAVVGKKKVRVYGVWDNGRIAAEHIELL